MKPYVAMVWTAIALVLVLIAGQNLTADQVKSGSYLQFTTSRHLIIPQPVQLGASSEDPVYLFKVGTEETISGLPFGEVDKITYVFAPAKVSAGKWVNPTFKPVSFTITSDQPINVTLIDAEPGEDWFLIIMVGIIIWGIVLLIIL